MNQQFKSAVWERLSGYDESSLAEIFNIFAADIDNREFVLNTDEAYIFNIMNNNQAALAVRKFGFEAVANASKEDWIIYAEKDAAGEWQFSSKSPTAAIEKHLEAIIHDIAARPRDYPSWVWTGIISQPLTNLLVGLYNEN